MEEPKKMPKKSMIQEQVRMDLHYAIREQSDSVSSLKVILGELQRQSEKDPDDEKIMQVLQTMKKNESVMIENGKGDPKFIELIDKYIPEQYSAEVIEQWIREHVNVESFKDQKMKIVGIVKKNFGHLADGKIVAEVVKGL